MRDDRDDDNRARRGIGRGAERTKRRAAGDREAPGIEHHRPVRSVPGVGAVLADRLADRGQRAGGVSLSPSEGSSMSLVHQTKPSSKGSRALTSSDAIAAIETPYPGVLIRGLAPIHVGDDRLGDLDQAATVESPATRICALPGSRVTVTMFVSTTHDVQCLGCRGSRRAVHGIVPPAPRGPVGWFRRPPL